MGETQKTQRQTRIQYSDTDEWSLPCHGWGLDTTACALTLTILTYALETSTDTDAGTAALENQAMLPPLKPLPERTSYSNTFLGYELQILRPGQLCVLAKSKAYVCALNASDQKNKSRLTSFHGISLYCTLQLLHFLQIEGLWQPCAKQLYWCHFSNSACSLHVSVSHLVIRTAFQTFHSYYVCHGDCDQ